MKIKIVVIELISLESFSQYWAIEAIIFVSFGSITSARFPEIGHQYSFRAEQYKAS